MKITPTLRALLVAMCLCMVFSLFACAEDTTTITDAPATDAPTEEKTEAPTSEKTEAPTQEKTEAPTDEPTEAPGCAHEEVVLEGKAATCTEAGLTEGKKCSKCDEILVPQEEIAALGHTEVTLDAVAPTCQATGLTEGKKCSVCDAVLTAQTEVAIDPNAHNMDNGTPAEAAKCGDKATVTYKCQNEGCTHTNVVEGEVLAHDMDEGTVTTAPTCTEKGVKTFTCKRNCGHSTTEEVAELGHDMDTEGSVTTAPTCTDKGVKTFACKRNCGHATTEEIPATGHGTPAADAVWTIDASAPQIEKTKCPNCDAMVTREATKTTAGFTVLGPEALMKCTDNRSYVKTVETENGMKYYHMVLAADNKEGNVTINDGTNALMGVEKYVFVIARKKGTESGVQVWLNAAGKTDHVGASQPVNYINVNAGWQLLIFDFSKAAQMSPENGIGWTRLDAIDGTANAKGTEFDIAAFGFAASMEEAQSYFGQYVKAYGFACPHMETAKSTYVQAGDKHNITCGICGEAMSAADHNTNSNITYNESTKTYVGKCVCGAEAHAAFLVKSEVSKEASASCAVSTGTDGDEDYVRFTYQAVGSGEQYTYLYKGDGSVYTGSIMVVKYRAPKGAKIGSFGNSFLGSVECTDGGAVGGASGNGGGGLGNALIADGEWHYVVVDVANKGKFKPSEDNKYYAKFVRASWGGGTFTDENGETKNSYIDIAFVAFADNLEAVNKYVAENETAPQFQTCFDAVNVTLNGEKLQNDPFGTSNDSIEIDLAGKTLNSAVSFHMGGWVCVRGGVASYKYRVVKVNGEAVAEPTEKAWAHAAGLRNDIYEAIGKGKNFTADCANGAGMDKAAIDLTGFEGQTVDVELVAVTNTGIEIVIAEIVNVAVPTAPAAE